jgi:hypothetical protein
MQSIVRQVPTTRTPLGFIIRWNEPLPGQGFYPCRCFVSYKQAQSCIAAQLYARKLAWIPATANVRTHEYWGGTYV